MYCLNRKVKLVCVLIPCTKHSIMKTRGTNICIISSSSVSIRLLMLIQRNSNIRFLPVCPPQTRKISSLEFHNYVVKGLRLFLNSFNVCLFFFSF